MYISVVATYLLHTNVEACPEGNVVKLEAQSGLELLVKYRISPTTFSGSHLGHFFSSRILGPGLRRGMLLAKVLSSLVLPIKLERAVVEIAAVEIAAGLQTINSGQDAHRDLDPGPGELLASRAKLCKTVFNQVVETLARILCTAGVPGTRDFYHP
ncbi:hypothetical protein B0H14DRAFT_2608406 [Mycena olivaceomarginata]|nr:hypothetical protein B0H14DRAFT_2608406 [Mycena olivaceomarginata]